MTTVYEDEPLTGRAAALRDEDRHDEAIALLRDAVAAGEPSAPEVLAYALMGSDRPRDALKVLKKVIKRGRTDLFSLLGSLASELGAARTADRAYREAIANGDLSALNDYGLFLRLEGRFAEAISVLSRSAEFGDDLAPGNLMALYLDKLDDPRAALEIGEKYLDPDKPAIYPALADVYATLGRLDDAEELFHRGVELDAPRIHQQYAWFLWLHRHDLAAAEREFWAAWDNDESGWGYALGYFLLDQGRTEEAKAILERGATWGDLNARQLLEELDRK
ncbi:tetratricopeptide repeat protein [Kutzneria sp. NPDC052558]|uniref:tetratricopeptide repeat protein n=1 Tax=Kutzneria sp. NPDC052558 TaxID=3364121 RepID=UPI0037C9B446